MAVGSTKTSVFASTFGVHCTSASAAAAAGAAAAAAATFTSVSSSVASASGGHLLVRNAYPLWGLGCGLQYVGPPRTSPTRGQTLHFSTSTHVGSATDGSGAAGNNGNALTHVDADGKASMVDVGDKRTTRRTAVAVATVLLGEKTYNLVAANTMKKGDVISVAELAGIMGAKHTATLIPLCHNIVIDKVAVKLTLDVAVSGVQIRATASTVGRTGVEMEALTAASVASLTVYDMCKAVRFLYA
jgi:cyclic pyranopterin phosphate synthase